ncbi:enhanced intracellular survival protein Eis [Streptomyces sp. R08]|uniref:Enhanced intracellular survival protein Eis n=1 Tax=Streptomyces sp. R08 TaxID=3238624 RepID=A0AB39MN37_9ACTN
MSAYDIRPLVDEQQMEALLPHMTRAFGKAPYDPHTLLREGYGAVATRGAEVVGGGFAISFDQYFGGRPVPSGGTAWLTVVPWARGGRLGRRIMQDKLAWLERERGAAIACMWSPATGMYRNWGWEVGAIGSSFSLRPTDAPAGDRSYEAFLPEREECNVLQRKLAQRWDGPLLRPAWWDAWKQQCTPALHHLGVRRDGELVGYASFVEEPVAPWGFRVVVHDFWTSRADAFPAVLDMLTTRSLQAREILFKRSVLPRAHYALWELPNYVMTEQGWYPWMVKLIDVKRAMEARGWSSAVEASVCVEVKFADDEIASYTFVFSQGSVEIKPGGNATVWCTEGTLASWFTGALAFRRARDFGRAWGDDLDIDVLDAALAAREPWVPESY